MRKGFFKKKVLLVRFKILRYADENAGSCIWLKGLLARHIRKLLKEVLPPGDDYLLEYWRNVDDIGFEWWALSLKGSHYFFETGIDSDFTDINQYVRDHSAPSPRLWKDESFRQLFGTIRFLRLKIRHPQMNPYRLYWLSERSIFEPPLRFFVRIRLTVWLQRAAWASIGGIVVFLGLSAIPSAKGIMSSMGILFPLFLVGIPIGVFSRFFLCHLARLYIKIQGRRFKSDDFLAAAREGDVPAVEAFLVAEMPSSSANMSGETALMQAAWLGKYEIVRKLIEAGAKVNLRDKNGKTALAHARAGWNKDSRDGVVRILLEAGADY